MIGTILTFTGGTALTLGAAYFMLRTMSMLKAGVALMGAAFGAALVLFTLHADVIATMTIMMFGPAMLGMILFMLMLMEDSGGFKMTSSSDDSVPAKASVENTAEPMPGMAGMAHGDRGGAMPVPTQASTNAHALNHDVESEVERAAAGILGPIGEISPMPDAMDMEMTNSQTRWAGWLALAFFVSNVVVIVATPWTRAAGAPSLTQPFLIGTALLEKYMLVFEGCGFLILLAVIVATMTGRKART